MEGERINKGREWVVGRNRSVRPELEKKIKRRGRVKKKRAGKVLRRRQQR